MTTDELRARVGEYIKAKRAMLTQQKLDAQRESQTAKSLIDRAEAEGKQETLDQTLDILKDLEIIVKE